jgi:hypothetical protein
MQKVVLVHVRQIDIPVAPYINTSSYMDDMAEERRQESHNLLRYYATDLHKRKVKLLHTHTHTHGNHALF